MPHSAKRRIQQAHDDWADTHTKNIAELPDIYTPISWERRVERLYRDTIIPNLEAVQRSRSLNDTERRVLDKAREFLGCLDLL